MDLPIYLIVTIRGTRTLEEILIIKTAYKLGKTNKYIDSRILKAEVVIIYAATDIYQERDNGFFQCYFT